MIKSEIRSTIKNLLPKFLKGSEYHNEVIDRAIEKVINQLYYESFQRDPLSLQRYTKRFGTTTPITVSYDTNAGIYYSSYPTGVRPISMPDKASGVCRIITKAQGGIKFYPMDQREMDLIMGGSYVNTVTNKVGYCVTQDRIEYYNMLASIVADGVRMDLLLPFSDYAETDEILMPETPSTEVSSSRQGERVTFTTMVLRILGVIQPQDTLDNNLDVTEKPKQ